MTEFLINQHEGRMTIMTRREDGQQFFFYEAPEELKDILPQLLDFAKSRKTDNEVSNDSLFEIIDQTLTDEQKMEHINIFPEIRVGLWVEPNKLYREDGVLYRYIQPSPTTLQEGWTGIGTPALFKRLGDINPDTGTVDEIQDFIHPTGAHDTYNLGDKVRYNGKVYESTLNNNAYSPDEYPQGWKEVI